MLNEIKEKWPEILMHLKRDYDISDVSFNTWLKPLEIAAVENDIIFIIVPEESVGLQIIKKKYYKPIKVCVEEITGHPYELEFILPDQFNKIRSTNTEPSDQNQNVYEKAGLNPKYKFSTFVEGDNNSYARSAALAVAEAPAELYNPLFIYGGVGLGKTHLMQAIANFILEKNPDAKVLYVTSDTFTNEIIDAVRQSPHNPMATAQFREKYRNVDVLLIDDIQFISGKESTQQEFFNTFNTLYENKKQIIMSSDKHPKEINNLEERLCSRFLWGLSVDIQSPNYETRVAILKKKTETDNSPVIPDDVINYIAFNISSNIRELEGALTKIIAYSRLTSTPIDMNMAENVLRDMLDNAHREITPDMIIKIVADHFNVSVSDLTSKKKSQDIAYPRQLIMYFCRTYTDVALSLVGKKLGNRDHSTVLYGFEKIQKELETNEKVLSDVEILKKKISPS